MVKTNKMFCIDEEIVDALRREESASALVNRLLREHYQKVNVDFMTKEDIERALKIEEIKDEMKKRIMEVENGK